MKTAGLVVLLLVSAVASHEHQVDGDIGIFSATIADPGTPSTDAAYQDQPAPADQNITQADAERIMNELSGQGEAAITRFINDNVNTQAGECHAGVTDDEDAAQQPIDCDGCPAWGCRPSAENRRHNLMWCDFIHKGRCPTRYWMARPRKYEEERDCWVVQITRPPNQWPFIQTYAVGECWNDGCPCHDCCDQYYRWVPLLVCCGCNEPIDSWRDWQFCVQKGHYKIVWRRIKWKCDCRRRLTRNPGVMVREVVL